MFDRLQQLSMDYYARTEVGDLLSRFSNDINSVQRGLAVAISWGLQPLMDLVLLTALVFALEWRLAAIGFLLCSLCVVGPQFFARRTAELSLSKQKEESRTHDHPAGDNFGSSPDSSLQPAGENGWPVPRAQSPAAGANSGSVY